MNKKYKTICFFFYILTAIFVFFAIGSLLDGIKDIHNLNPVKDIIKINITIISGILAIFFTLSAIVIQNILQKYSSNYLKVILSRVIFKILLVLLPISVIFNLLLLYYGSNKNLEKFSLFLAIYIVISVSFAIVQLIDFLSISNIVSFISTQAFNHINKISDPGIIKIEEKKKHLPFLLKIKALFYKLTSKKSFFILMESLANNISVPQKNIEILGNDVRPIFSTCHKALNDDDREVVLSCLDNLKNIILSYLDKRKNYRGMEDNFLLFLNGQFEITLNIAVRSYNQQYLEDIIKRVDSIAIKCVELTDTQIRIGENGLVFTWIEFLKNSIWKTMYLKHTSAPPLAIESIYKVGIGLIEKDAFKTSIYSVGNSLEEIGTNTSRVPGPFHALLTQRCIYGLLKMSEDFLRKIIDEGKMFSGREVKGLCGMISTIMDNAFSSNLDFMSYSTIQAPLSYSIENDNISFVIYAVLNQECDDKNKIYLFKCLIYINECLSKISKKAIINNKGRLDEYLMVFSEIMYHYSKYLSNFNDHFDTKDYLILEIRKELSNLMNKLVENITNIYKIYLPCDSFMSLFHISPVFAFLTYFADDKKSSKLLLEARNMFITQLLNIYKELKQKDVTDKYNRGYLYRYIKLFGAWINKLKNNSINKDIIRVLANEYEEVRYEKGILFESEMQNLGYPGGDIGGEWYIFPSKYWVNDQWKITNELNDKSNNYLNYHLYDEKITKYFNLFVKKKKN
jgi:hypothetical protein